MSARRDEASDQILRGEPGIAARQWLGWVSLVAFLLFVVDTYLVLSGATRVVDIPVARAVQAFPWGPLSYPMRLSNATGGWPQYLLGIIAVAAMFLYERRAGWLLALGSIASVLDSILKVSVQRHRPTADLVTILRPTHGYSYASGHAVFYTWLCFMVAVAIVPRLRPAWRVVTWVTAAVVIVLVCLGRVWAGAHWPSDVVGGFLLGMAWAAFVLWLPERWLPSPSMRWVPGRGRAVRVR